MKSIITLLCFFFFSISLFSQLNMTLRGQVEYTQQLNDIWGYADDQGNEYALVGAFNGVSIVNVTDPDAPSEVAYLPGVGSMWRDLKTWGTNAYVTNETGEGVMVIDLSMLPDTATAYNWEPNLPGLGTLGPCHNIFIDEFGIAYLTGCNLNNGGLLYVNVDTPDGAPEYIDKGTNEYSHDVYVRDNLAYSSEIEIGVFTIYDVTDKSNTIALGTQATAASTTHNAWLSDDGNYLFTTDETGNAPIGSYDVSNPTDIIELDQFRPFETLQDGVVPHNVHVWNDWIIVSYYSDGCIVIDGSEPDNLVEVGNFDTWLGGGTGFNGAWGAYPFLPSQTVLVTDQANGLYVMTPTYVRAARIEGLIFDSANNTPLPNAAAAIDGTTTKEFTAIDGLYKTGYHTGGTYDFTFSKPGYISKTITVDIANDSTVMLNVGLDALSSFSITANVTDEETGAPIPNASISLINDDFNFEAISNDQGVASFNGIYEGSYDLAAGKWGYKTKLLSSLNVNNGTTVPSVELSKGIEDIFSVDLGWEVTGNAATGDWELADPNGVFVSQAGGLFITPDEDDNDEGSGAYVTDNGLDIFEDRVSGGGTKLTSPVFDLSNTGKPMVKFSTWFFSVDPNSGDGGNDNMRVEISNGDTTAFVASFSMGELAAPFWEVSEIDVAAYLTPSENMQISFSISNLNGDITEGGVDNFSAWDADPISSTSDIQGELNIKAQPNPTNDFFSVKWDGQNLKNSSLEIFSILGRPIEKFEVSAFQNEIQLGENYSTGIYLAQFSIDQEIVKTIKLIKQ